MLSVILIASGLVAATVAVHTLGLALLLRSLMKVALHAPTRMWPIGAASSSVRPVLQKGVVNRSSYSGHTGWSFDQSSCLMRDARHSGRQVWPMMFAESLSDAVPLLKVVFPGLLSAEAAGCL